MRTTILAIIALAAMCGCSRIPEPASYPYSQQQKLQAAHHWDVLAKDVANRINNQLIISNFTSTPVYVKATCGDEDTPCDLYQTSTFNEAFRDLLITELVHLGVPVDQHAGKDAITVHYKVQTVYHQANRLRSIRPGVITVLSTAISVLRNAPSEVVAMAAGGTLDLANQSMVVNGHFEVIITTSMVRKSRYLFRASDIYYINDIDFYQYNNSLPQTATIKIAAPPAPKKSESEPMMPPPSKESQGKKI